MARQAAVLGVHILTPDGHAVRAGTLTLDAVRATAFVVDEAYRSLSNGRWAAACMPRWRLGRI